MFFQQKSTIVALITTIIIFILYAVFVFQKWDANPPDEFKFWATAIVVIIPVLIMAQIITQVIFIVINSLVTGEEAADLPADEFDKLVDLKATRNFYHVFMIGFVSSMISQILDAPPSTMFTIMFFSFMIAGVTIDVSRLYYYRRGF